MARYIDVDIAVREAINACNKLFREKGEFLTSLDAVEIAEALDDIPAADVVEIPKNGIGNLSDGYHTFNELYHHRAVLFSVICNMFPDKAWKSKLHDTGDMYDGMFIVGIETPDGQATYHYDIEPYWEMFKVKELEKAPKWDGHTPTIALERISTICAEGKHGEWISLTDCANAGVYCSVCHKKVYKEDYAWCNRKNKLRSDYCPNCGAKMDGGRKNDGKG